MEFLRLGSSIPGSYWGCCAVDIIQNFSSCSPDDPASIELVEGDGGYSSLDENGEKLFLGKTYREIFMSRLRIGTFCNDDMPNHAFLAILAQDQLDMATEWLEILKETGFEFIRCVDNSVYTGPWLITHNQRSSHKNYIFGLFRNIGAGAVDDPFKPPSEWLSLPDPYKGDMSEENRRKVQLDIWDKIGPAVVYTEQELAGVPITLAGIRSEYPQEPAKTRKYKEEQKKKTTASAFPFTPSL